MTDEQTAAQLVSFGQCSTDAEFEAAIVRALQAAYANGFTNGHTVGINHEANRGVLRMCHEARMMNGIVDYSDPNATGVVRTVLGTLPVTADGCVVGDAAHLWTNNAGEVNALRADAIGATEFGEDGDFYEAAECYSTREAAEAAKEANK